MTIEQQCEIYRRETMRWKEAYDELKSKLAQLEIKNNAHRGELAVAYEDRDAAKLRADALESDAAAMREVLRLHEAAWKDCYSPQININRIREALAAGSGQCLLDELAAFRAEFDRISELVGHSPASSAPLSNTVATLRDTAKRRLVMLKKIEWFLGQCWFCLNNKDHGHKPTCPLASELKEGK